MSGAVWSNFLTYSLQIALLVGVAGWIPAAARLASPKARLAFFQALLAACLLLPAVRPWKSETIALESLAAAPRPVSTAGAPIGARAKIDPRDLVLAAIAAGIAARLGMLALGMLRLRRYRRRSVALRESAGSSAAADIRISQDISGPVTFGFLRPVILLPAHFPDMPAELREAILCHETLHVRRRDWVFTVAEELIRAGLWFHPAIWWVLGEIQLAREQAVDREAVSMTNARDPYVDALLAAAGAAFEADLAPAPLFLRKRHLKQRVVSILKEKHMSKTRTVSTLAASLALVAGACWYLSGALPLAADPELAPDGPGVSVDMMGAQVMHRGPVYYPSEALAKNIEGVVVAQVKVDTNGNVTDVSILSGPDELRKTVLESLLTWHFTQDAAGGTRQVAITFRAPEASSAAAATANAQSGATASIAPGALPPEAQRVMTQMGQLLDQAQRDLPQTRKMATPPGPPPEQAAIRSITVQGMGVPDEQVTSKLPLRVGDLWTRDSQQEFGAAVHQIDRHLRLSWGYSADRTQVDVRISAPEANFAPRTAPPAPPGTINVGGRVQASKLIRQVQPVYPDLARQARISGAVELAALIGPDGHMQQLSVISGHPLLRQAAIDAVQQWVYQPTLLNGQPVTVSTTIDVIFSLEN